jgi:RimJ/RimL family protein N-acetyltransferase
MDIKLLSSKYKIRVLNKEDVSIIYSLLSENTEFFRHCPPFVTYDSIISDMHALPPKKTMDDKYYIGYFLEDELVAVMDLIDNCPKKDSVFIGFFMVKKSLHRNGVGKSIINELIRYLNSMNYKEVRLGCIESNIVAYKFWSNLGFIDTSLKNVTDLYTVNILKKVIG